MMMNGFYGVAGFPVLHSKSPELFSLFSGEKGRYGRFSAATEEELLMILTHFPLKGLNITSPLKETALKLADKSDEAARNVGAANLLVREEGLWKACNTDYTAVRALIRKNGIPKGCRVLVAGAGGAGKAAVLAALHEEMDVFLANRSAARGEKTAEVLKIPLVGWDSSWESFRLLISALPRQADPLALHPEFKGKIIDAAYPGSKTALRGLKKGLKTFRGEEWLIEQGKASYVLMTGSEPLTGDPGKEGLYSLKKDKPLILTGFMGSGKTALGEELEKEGMTLFSTDAEIEKKTLSGCNEAFSTLGEEAFRTLEREIISRDELFSCDVIDSGGGLWLDPVNRERIPPEALVLFLWTTPETALKRASDRPLLSGKDIEEIFRLYETRLTSYFSLSDLVLATESFSVPEAAGRIKEEMKLSLKEGDEIGR